MQWQKWRSKFLKAIYDRDKRPAPFGRVNVAEIAKVVELDGDKCDIIAEQLKSEYLIEWVATNGLLGLTPSGIRAVEDLISGVAPNTTLNFAVKQFVVQNNTNSNIAITSESPNANIHQESVLTDDAIRALVSEAVQSVRKVLDESAESMKTEAVLKDLESATRKENLSRRVIKALLNDVKEVAAEIGKNGIREVATFTLQALWVRLGSWFPN